MDIVLKSVMRMSETSKIGGWREVMKRFSRKFAASVAVWQGSASCLQRFVAAVAVR
ncbi:MAG TPA: hypothetical protein VG328_13360 [Stellaceae bacterium]|nr:hypothetical protein [Stellaceae bacterium]